MAAIALAAGSSAMAQPLKTVPAALDPTKAYVLVEYRLRANPYASLPGSRKTMPLNQGLVLARYDRALGDIRGLGRAKQNSLPAKQSAFEGFRNKPLVKAAESRLFLLELEPDTWVVQGWGNTSFSLGSYAFDLAPGTITDLGVVVAEDDWAEGDRPPTVGSLFKGALLGPFSKRPDVAPIRVRFEPRGPKDIAVPAALPAGSVQPVRFEPDAKFGNYLGGLVNRIEGVNARLKAQSVAVKSADPVPEAAAPDAATLPPSVEPR